ncbi:HlyD family secretion protein [Variovorax guangxiensis]|uniref:HlyD family secretion protein n=1 Tax=Variovorax guangxiensis TaxID=1775474 RepID=UPI002857048E|nr:HlyD family secretion protein [Variovorax guangxiensis]MDR6858500.1 RND family efflux transporter MFP subunit [Variovorax guangxiensis]
MKPTIQTIGRVALTLALVGAALFVGHLTWDHYREAPWTRDGRVRADVIQIAPDVSGLVEQVAVRDNQPVSKGDVLFTIDRARQQLAAAQAEATVQGLRVQIEQARRENRRNVTLGDLVPAELREQGSTRVDQLKASLAQASAALDTARLNLERTEVRAPVDGWVTNLDLRPGAYATAGRPVFALVDRQSLHVQGYFEETKLGRIAVGAPVRVRLIGETQWLDGHVDSIAAAIEDRERGGSTSLLANVNPTFNWVRLAQRIPVRVQLDQVPQDARLIAGRTATVEVVEAPRGTQVAQGAR